MLSDNTQGYGKLLLKRHSYSLAVQWFWLPVLTVKAQVHSLVGEEIFHKPGSAAKINK